MGLIRESALLQMPNNDNGLITASNARTVFGVVEDCLTDGITDLETIINNIQTGANAVGNLYEVQMKGDGNTLLSSDNFTYHTVNDEFLLRDSSFTVSNSITKFILPAVLGNNFLITSNNNEVDNLVEISTSDNLINIGATGSNITLRRGSSVLDESIVLEENLTTISNTDLVVKSASSVTGDAFKLTNSDGANLKTYINDGKTTRQATISIIKSPTGVTNIDLEQITLTVSGGSGTVQAIGKSINYSIVPEIGIPHSYVGQRITMSSNTLLTNGLIPTIAYSAFFTGNNITNAHGFLSSGQIATGYSFQAGDNPTVITGWAKMSANTNSGFEVNRYNINEISPLIRLKKANLNGTTAAGSIVAPVGSGISINFDQVVALNVAGTSFKNTADKLGIRIASIADSDSPVTSEMFFKTTQQNVSVEPLKLTGKDVTVGTTDSNIILRRGSSVLDESLSLDIEALTLNNANFSIKSASNTIGNAFTLLDNSNRDLLTIGNNGSRSKNVATTFSNAGGAIYNRYTTNITTTGSATNNNQYNDYNVINVTTDNTVSGNVQYHDYYRVLNVNGPKATSNVRGLYMEVNNTTGGNALAGYFNNILSIGKFTTSAPTNDLRGYVSLTAHGTNTGATINYLPNIGGMVTTLRLSRNQEAGNNMLAINDGVQMSFSGVIDRRQNDPNPGYNETSFNNKIGVRVKNTTQFLPTTEMFFTSTESNIEVEPLSLHGRGVKIAESDGRVGFYGETPIVKQDLPTNPTNAELATVLANLGLVNLI